MARIPARALAVPFAAVLMLTAACGGEESADTAPKAAKADAQITLVDAPAKSVGLTGDGRTDTAAASGTPGAAASESAAATPKAATGTSAPPAGTGGSAKWVQLSVNQATIGETVTDVTGFTLYTFADDPVEPSSSKCVEACAKQWPPVLIQVGGRVFVDGLKPGTEVAAIRRPDGGVQVTIAGRPVYRFSEDVVPGDVNGQASGNKWFAIDSSGQTNANLIATAPAEPAEPDRTAKIIARKVGGADVVVDDDGATLYRFDGDDTDPPASNCTDECAYLWQPVVADNDAKVEVVGIDEDRVWWLRREDGTKQVTIDGSPLYRNVADKSTDTIATTAAVKGWTPAR